MSYRPVSYTHLDVYKRQVIASTTFGTLTMGEVFLSIVVNGSFYKEAFRERGLRPEMLSRLLEEGGTLTQVSVSYTHL